MVYSSICLYPFIGMRKYISYDEMCFDGIEMVFLGRIKVLDVYCNCMVV